MRVTVFAEKTLILHCDFSVDGFRSRQKDVKAIRDGERVDLLDSG